MFDVNDAAVLKAWLGSTPGNPSESGSDGCTRCRR